MKVLHIFKTYYPDTQGGTEQFIAQLSWQTTRLGVENTVLTLSPHPFPENLLIDGVTVVRLQETGRPWGLPWSWALMRRFRDVLKDYDLIHFHHPWPFAEILYVLSGLKKPAITTYHLDLVRSSFIVRIYNHLLKFFFPRLSAIVATSQAYANSSLVLNSYGSKVSVVPIGLDLSRHPSPSVELVSHWRSRINVPFFLFVGSFRYYKGIDVLLKAASQVPIPIILVGKGMLYETMQARAIQYGVSDRVQFLGEVSEADKWALIEACRVLVLPSTSRAEAFGICLLEAMVYGKPLITTELATGTSWVNQDKKTGYVVPPNDPEALAKAMNLYVQDEALVKAHGQAARERLETLFTADKMGQAYWNIYQKAVLHHV